MICQACRERRHDDCRGGSWCACQHQAVPATPEQRDAAAAAAAKQAPTEQAPGEPASDGTAGDGAEPPVNWMRQG